MKVYAILAIAFFSLSGCAGSATKSAPAGEKRKLSSTDTHQCVAKAGPNCTAKIRWICAEGFHDACRDNPNGIHTCVPDVSSACNTRIMHHCPDHFENGCHTGATTNHSCVAEEGSSCAQEIAMDCPAGFTDRCLMPDSEWDGPRNND